MKELNLQLNNLEIKEQTERIQKERKQKLITEKSNSRMMTRINVF